MTGEGIADVRARVGPGRTAVLVGSSGVGKSTLINRWLGEELLATRETRADDDEGRHTTTRRELLLLPGGGIVIDTPGIRELQLWDATASGALEEAFADVEELAATCGFHDCAHGVEPGCAVKAALADGSLPLERYASWQKLQRELRSIAIRADARLRKEQRKRWNQVTREARTRTRYR